MNRSQFLRDLRTYCKANGHDPPVFNAMHGKGGHGRVRVGQRFTTIPSGELKRFTVENILKQLGLPKDAL